MTSTFQPNLTAATAPINPNTQSTSYSTYDISIDSIPHIDPTFAPLQISMSLHRPGDAAPLPSPSSLHPSSDHYFPPFGMSADGQSQHQQIQQSQQQQALLQAQRQAKSQQEHYYAQQQFGQEQQQQQPTHEAEFHLQEQNQAQFASAQLQSQQAQPRQLQLQDPTRLSPGQAHQQQRQAMDFVAPPGTQHQERQMSQSSTDSEASLHLRDFSLVAEAAKRAQMAVVTRDLEDISL